MRRNSPVNWIATVSLFVLLAVTAAGSPIPFFFSTGNPDGKIGTLSRPPQPGLLETETADDFITTLPTTINGATFVGLLPAGASLGSVSNVEIEFYHVFPVDSTNPPSGNVPTRANSPSDNQFLAFDRAAGDISVTATLLNSSFAVANTVVNGINKSPNQFTGGEGPATGEEVVFTVVFNAPLTLPAGHFFFRPEVGLISGNFLWLSAPKPIAPPGTAFSPDLQSWIRNADLSPDWLRIGTDITGQGPFNAAFSLEGTESATPEPSTLLLVGMSLLVLGFRGKTRKRA